MVYFEAEDGYSYHIAKIDELGYETRTYRIDSEKINFQLGTHEYLVIKRLDISPETSIKLKNIRESCN